METLKNLISSCTLIASFKEHAFVVFDGFAANLYHLPNSSFLFYDNKSTYFVYTFINKPKVSKFDNKTDAYIHFIKFISTLLID